MQVKTGITSDHSLWQNTHAFGWTLRLPLKICLSVNDNRTCFEFFSDSQMQPHKQQWCFWRKYFTCVKLYVLTNSACNGSACAPPGLVQGIFGGLTHFQFLGSPHAPPWGWDSCLGGLLFSLLFYFLLSSLGPFTCISLFETLPAYSVFSSFHWTSVILHCMGDVYTYFFVIVHLGRCRETGRWTLYNANVIKKNLW